jgi:hypothetical protein
MKILTVFTIVYTLLTPILEAAISGNHEPFFGENQEDRLYINPSKIQVNQKGIWLMDDRGEIHPLYNLLVDAHGLYTVLGREKLATVWNIVWCNTCNAYRTTDIKGRCVICGNTP